VPSISVPDLRNLAEDLGHGAMEGVYLTLGSLGREYEKDQENTALIRPFCRREFLRLTLESFFPTVISMIEWAGIKQVGADEIMELSERIWGSYIKDVCKFYTEIFKGDPDFSDRKTDIYVMCGAFIYECKKQMGNDYFVRAQQERDLLGWRETLTNENSKIRITEALEEGKTGLL
jgi:hypothetical protein